MRKLKALGRLKSRLSANGPGLTVAVIAMLVALTGASFAASGALTSKQKKEVKGIVKQEAKKLRGPAGAAGPTGSVGPQGATGAKGGTGAAGQDGASVKVTEISEGEEGCAELGGVSVEKEGSDQSEEVCNGAKGAKGEKGEPWTPNNALPAGATVSGVWAFNGDGEQKITAEVGGVPTEYTVGNKNAFAPLSFLLPLKANLASGQVHYQTDAEFANFCTGSATAPIVAPGNLCVYEGNELNEAVQNATFQGIHRAGGAEAGAAGANRAGALLVFETTGANASGNGTFAVTAPNPVVTGVSPAQGPAAGGTSVTITGINLGGTVKFGGVTATCDPANSAGTEITCTTPPGAAGPVDVVVTVSGYESPVKAATKFTYQ